MIRITDVYKNTAQIQILLILAFWRVNFKLFFFFFKIESNHEAT